MPIQKTQTQTQHAGDTVDFNKVWNTFKTQVKQNNLTLSPQQEDQIKVNVHHAVASAKDTKDALEKMKAPTERMLKQLASAHQSGMKDSISDEQAAKNAGADSVEGYVDKPKLTPEHLPAVISQEMRASGQNLNVKWHQVKHLPGYLQSGIRAIGRKVFSPFTIWNFSC